jgi:hypothetical protein
MVFKEYSQSANQIWYMLSGSFIHFGNDMSKNALNFVIKKSFLIKQRGFITVQKQKKQL